ncbi:Uncharacterised protein [Legionella pneumophila subsp. pascullei]|uniref:Uncharacterized protein n=1 Tax=Legionella pneumophila subsp. pascullei TaxID=91890 RepID=A0AAX2IXT9_LEGPN|nr:Uncharacterised protein [Legionella pneumophila subsp. pascullei]VEH07227.1 Uncharacterised protein [Legionella pneumophila subsp. pascullei]
MWRQIQIATSFNIKNLGKSFILTQVILTAKLAQLP